MNRRIEHRVLEDTEPEDLPELRVLPISALEKWFWMTDSMVHGPDARPKLAVEAFHEPDRGCVRSTSRSAPKDRTAAAGSSTTAAVQSSSVHGPNARFWNREGYPGASTQGRCLACPASASAQAVR